MASATGDKILHNKKLVKSSESPPLPLPLPSANDGRSRAEWLQTMLNYEKYYRGIGQMQKQQTSPNSANSTPNSPGSCRSKNVVGSSGNTSTSIPVTGSSVTEHKKSKHSGERKSITGSGINSNAVDTATAHHKKSGLTKELGRKI